MSALDFATFTAVTRRLYEYAYGIDTRDWTLYRSIFTDQIDMDFSSYSGEAAKTFTADDWVRGVQPLFEGLDATQHSLSNPLIDVEGNRARCRMYMQAEHFLTQGQGDSSYAIGGYYDDQLIRTDMGWRISAVTLNVLWHRGNKHIMSLAVQGQR